MFEFIDTNRPEKEHPSFKKLVKIMLKKIGKECGLKPFDTKDDFEEL